MNRLPVRLALCGTLVALGTSVVAGWLLGIEVLKSVLPGLSTMKFNAALCFILVGAGLAGAGARDLAARRAAAVCGALAALIGGLTLAEYLGGYDFGIDQLVVADRGVLTGSGIPGRMSPLTASAWLALGSAILLLALGRSRRAIILAHILAVYAGFVAFLAAAGYAFGAEAFWGIGFYTAMAVHTAVGLMIGVAAALITRSDEGWLAGFVDAPTARGLLIQLLPVALLLPTLLGFLLLLGSGIGAYNAAFGFALFVPSTALGLVAAALRLAGRARHTELALRESRERHRQIFEQVNDIIFTADLDQVITDCNPAAAEAMGLRREELIGSRISDFVSEEGFEQTSRMLRSKLEQGGTTRHDIEVFTRDGRRLFWEINSGLAKDGEGRTIGIHAIARDVTDRKAFEERQRLLINELNHRVKNTLAIVQSVARQTLRKGEDPEATRIAFEGRLATLSTAHDLLTREHWEAVDLAHVITEATASCGSGERSMTVEGPAIRLAPKTAVTFAMAMHELCTNALKYGALSAPDGRIEVRWTIDEDAQGKRLRLKWEEKQGPPVQPPARRGFGSRMIERALASELGGEIKLEFRPEGLVCSIDAPVPAEDLAKTL
jgi:PAS domain S-box-containing protein